MLPRILVAASLVAALLAAARSGTAPSAGPGEGGRALVLQEMSWVDVREYLKRSDMVIVPLGSTEQHGPHLPLGSDFFEATGIAGRISARTGVVVAPVLQVGYSVYHAGFPGTLSLEPDTMERVLFETAEMLIRHGFRRIMFFNNHGGNRIVEQKVIHRINHETVATAVAIGISSPIQEDHEELPAPFDYHAGIKETSIMLHLRPELVRMERAEKPTMTLSPTMQELVRLGEEHPAFQGVLGTMLGVPEETGKGGASHELSSNGVWSFGDPSEATRERGERAVGKMVENAVRFIEAWKTVKR